MDTRRNSLSSVALTPSSSIHTKNGLGHDLPNVGMNDSQGTGGGQEGKTEMTNPIIAEEDAALAERVSIKREKLLHRLNN